MRMEARNASAIVSDFIDVINVIISYFIDSDRVILMCMIIMCMIILNSSCLMEPTKVFIAQLMISYFIDSDRVRVPLPVTSRRPKQSQTLCLPTRR